MQAFVKASAQAGGAAWPCAVVCGMAAGISLSSCGTSLRVGRRGLSVIRTFHLPQGVYASVCVVKVGAQGLQLRLAKTIYPYVFAQCTYGTFSRRSPYIQS
jgi:hypothetical protein